MNEKKEIIQQLRTNIGRYDSYYDSVNTKARFLMFFAVFIIGTVILQANKFADGITNSCLLYAQVSSIIIVLLCCFYLLILIIKSIFPYLDNGNKDLTEKTSLIYFGDVANSGSIKNYQDRVKAEDLESMIDDLSQQCYLLSKGLRDKFGNIKRAYTALYVIIAFLFIITAIKVGSSL